MIASEASKAILFASEVLREVSILYPVWSDAELGDVVTFVRVVMVAGLIEASILSLAGLLSWAASS